MVAADMRNAESEAVQRGVASVVSQTETARLCAQWDRIRAAKLLVVDDEPANILLVNDLLQAAQYVHIQSTNNPCEVVSRALSYRPDVVLLDLMMPEMGGLAVLAALGEQADAGLDCDVIVLTADVSTESKRRALRLGAREFLTKPFDVLELLLRIENVLESRFLRLEVEQHCATLEQKIQERTASLREAQMRVELYAKELECVNLEMLERLALAGEFRDDDTGSHTTRVARVSSLIAEELGFDSERVEGLYQAARLHDAGKIGIPDVVLLKPGKLTPSEMETMRGHTTIGGDLFANGHSELMRMASRIAKSHHEKFDGTGYPSGLAGTEIPIEARIVGLADVFDALTHVRPYKGAWPLEDAIAEIRAQCGRHFDPDVVEAFMKLPHAELI